MNEYKIKTPSGSFLARILANSAEDASSIMLHRIRSIPAEVEGEITYLREAVLSEYMASLDGEVVNADAAFHTEEIAKKQEPRFKDKLCVYCGLRNSTQGDGDHVIARGFFEKAKRNNTNVPILVPACEECNNIKSREEEYAISRIAASIQSEHPAARELFSEGGPMHRSLRRGRGPVAEMASNARRVFVPYGPNGELVETGIIDIDWSRIEHLISFMVRGLYYETTGSIFPLDYDVVALQVADANWTANEQAILKLPHNGIIDLGDGVFRFAYAGIATAGSATDATHWSMSFYSFAGKGFRLVAYGLPLKKVGDLLRLPPQVAIAPSGDYTIEQISGDEIQLRRVNILKSGRVQPTDQRVTVLRYQLIGFMPLSITEA